MSVLGALLRIVDGSYLDMVEVAGFERDYLGGAWLDNHVEVSFSHQQLESFILLRLEQLRLKQLNLERNLQIVCYLHG